MIFHFDTGKGEIVLDLGSGKTIKVLAVTDSPCVAIQLSDGENSSPIFRLDASEAKLLSRAILNSSNSAFVLSNDFVS